MAEIHSITTETRESKLAEITTPAVLAAQRAQLSPAELGELKILKAQAGIRAGQRVPSPGRESQSLAAAISHLYERQSVVTGHAVLAEALNQNLGGVELPRLHAKAKEAGLVGLTDEPWVHQKFATVEGLALEKWAVDFVDRTRGQCGPLGGDNIQIIAPFERGATGGGSSGPGLPRPGGLPPGRGWRREIHGSARNLPGIWLRRACRSFAARRPARPPIRSARMGLAVTTLSAFLARASNANMSICGAAVIICDEVGLTSNRQGAELLAIAEQHSARVLFLGDSRQHTAVEAGDFLRVLESHSKLHRVELTAIRRQENKAYRAAVRCLAAGAARVGLERLDDLGWVKEGRAGYLRGAVGDFMRLSDDGRNPDRVLAVTPTWAEHEAFTAELRTRLKAIGALGPGENDHRPRALEMDRDPNRERQELSAGHDRHVQPSR